MILNISRVTSIEDIDFDSLFESSFPQLDYNYFLSFRYTGPSEEKKNLYKTGLVDALNGVSTYRKENQEVFGYKLMIDGIDHCMNVGFLNRATGAYETSWFLTKPYNDSRNFMYSAEYNTLRNAFLAENGIEYFEIVTVVRSQLYNTLKGSSTASRLEMIDEVLADNGVSVTLKFRLL